MCRSIEEMLEKNAKEVTERNKLEFARRMIADKGLPLEKIAEYSDLPLEDVRKLASEIRGKRHVS